MATWYIDPNGSDSTGNGTIGNPWKSLNKACATVHTASDIIHVNAGSYTETYQSVLVVGVSIEGTGDTSIITSSVGSSASTIVASSGPINTNGNQHISGIKLIGSNPMSSYAGIAVINRGNVKIYNCTISNFYYSGVMFYSGNDLYPQRLPAFEGNYSQSNEIYNCTITGCGYFTGGNEGCLSLRGQDGILIHDNVLTANGFSDHHGDAIKAVDGYLKNIKIYNNQITNVFVPGPTPQDFAIEFWDLYENNEIYNNVIIGSVDIVMCKKNGGTYSVWIHDNDISQQSVTSFSRRGILTEYETEGVIIERNYFHNLATGVSIQTASPGFVTDMLIRYNLIAGATYYGIIATEEDIVSTISGLVIYNNVIVSGPGGSKDVGICPYGMKTLTNCHVYNNIIVGWGRGFYTTSTNGRSGTGLIISNNIFYQNTTNISSAISYTGTNQLSVNPLFISTSNFHLQAGSPAINAGVYITATTDKDGVTVSNPPEVGAYEYGQIPTVTTSTITNIGNTTATSGGNVTSAGSSGLTSRGVCWSIIANPTILNSYTEDGASIGSFVSSLTGLSAGTAYWVRAYATNTYGTAYGANILFTTTGGVVLPTVTTTAVTSITDISASSGGNVTDAGNGTITVRGVVWSTIPSPDISLTTKTSNGTGTGVFTSSVTGLTQATTYYIRAYATNGAGTAYGNQIIFTTFTTNTVPVVTTQSVTNISYITASGNGTLVSAGGLAISSRGFVWSSTNTTPTISDNSVSFGTGIGSYTIQLTSLQQGTLYYVRAYAQNSLGYGYGSVVAFTTLGYALATLTTTTISSITQTTASSGGTISNDGGATITSRGVVWDTSSSPTISGSHSSDGTGIGTFVSSIISLTANTVYYVRAYATNSVGTAYGNELIFTSGPTIPVVIINNYYNLTQVSVNVTSNVTNNGGSIVTSRGVAYSTSPNPTIADSHTIDGQGNGSFSSSITGLSVSTTYYIRAYSTNSVGTAYSSQNTFVTLSPAPNYLTISTIHHWETVSAYKYGILYNWYAATYSTGGASIAPTGWHVPTYAEAWTLCLAIDPSAVNRDNNTAGGPMKEIGLTYWSTPNTDATNTSGWNGKGTGDRLADGNFVNFQSTSTFWNVEAYDATNGRASLLQYQNHIFSTSGPGATYPNAAPKKNGCAIRLIKDDSTDPGTMTDYDGTTYPTVKIGNQVWMAQNLKVHHYNDGTEIPLVSSNAAWAALSTGAMCYYDNDTQWE